MRPLTTLYDEYIDRSKLSEQKNPFEYIVLPPSIGVGTKRRNKVTFQNVIDNFFCPHFVNLFLSGIGTTDSVEVVLLFSPFHLNLQAIKVPSMFHTNTTTKSHVIFESHNGLIRDVLGRTMVARFLGWQYSLIRGQSGKWSDQTCLGSGT